jgi:hypothetical protein
MPHLIPAFLALIIASPALTPPPCALPAPMDTSSSVRLASAPAPIHITTMSSREPARSAQCHAPTVPVPPAASAAFQATFTSTPSAFPPAPPPTSLTTSPTPVSPAT